MDEIFPQSGGRRDEQVDLRGYWNFLRRNRGVVLASVALAFGASILISTVARPIYEASASIRIDEGERGASALALLGPLSSGSGVETEMEVLRSRTVAEEVVGDLQLRVELLEPRRRPRAEVLEDLRVADDAALAEYRLVMRPDGRYGIEELATGARLGTVAPGTRVEVGGVSFRLSSAVAAEDEIRFLVRPFEETVLELREALEVERPNPDANIVIVRYRGADSLLVREVPNALAATFIEGRRDVHKTEARSTAEFLRRQLESLSEQLLSAENSLRAFREGERVVHLEAEAYAQVGHLADFQAQRNATEAERAALAQLLEAVRAAAAGPDPGPSPYRRLMAFPTLFRHSAAANLLGSLSALEDQRAEVLIRRTARDPDVMILTERIQQVEEQLHTLAVTYLQGLTNQVTSLDATLARFGDELERIPAKEIQFARLQRQSKVLEEIYVLLHTRLKDAEITEAVEDPSVRVVDQAIVPLRPVYPRPILNGILAIVLGLMLGVVTGFTRERLDNTVASREDVQSMAGIPVLGLIPRIRVEMPGGTGLPLARAHDAAQSEKYRLITGSDPRSPVSEAYRSLRTNITFSRPGSPLKRLVITSPTPGDGKTTSAANLAVTLGQQGIRTLIIDADLRRGLLNLVFEAPREPGLSDLVMGIASTEAAIRSIRIGEGHSLDFLATGTLPPNPAELIGSSRLEDLLARLGESYDVILIDSPPLNVVTDAAILSRVADGVVIVVRAGKTERDGLAFAMEQLNRVRAPVLGAVLNDANARRPGYYRSYDYKYAHASGAGSLGSQRPWPGRWIKLFPRRPPKV